MAVRRIGLLLACLLALAVASPSTRASSPSSLLEAGEYAAAESAAHEALDALDGESLRTAELLDVLLEARWRGGKATEPETREIGERVLALKRRLLGAGSASEGKTQHHLAILSFFAGDLDRAGELWRESIDNRTRGLGPDHPDVAESLNGLANLYQTTGRFEEARPLYEQAVRIRSAAYGPESPRVAQTLANLGLLLIEIGDFAAAVPYAEQALRIKLSTLGEEHPETSLGHSALGRIYFETGDYDRALDSYRRALAIDEARLGPTHDDVGAALNNIADILRRRGELDEAIARYERTLAIWEANKGPDHPDVALALNGLASTLEAAGELARARELQRRGVAIREAALGPEHYDVAESLASLARVEAALGDDAAAAEAYDRVIAIRRAAFGAEHPTVAEGLGGAALVRARSGDAAGALRLALDAERIARDHLRLTGRALAEEHALRYAASRTRGSDLALTLALERPGEVDAREVLDTVIRSRAVVLDEIAARHRVALGSTDPAVRRLAGEFAEARKLLANLIVRGPGSDDLDEYNAKVATARDAKELAERALGAASATFAREQRLLGAGLDDVAGALPPRSALVAYVGYDHVDIAPTTTGADGTPRPRAVPSERRYAALVLRAGHPRPTVVALGPAAALDAAVTRWKREAARGATNIRRTPDESEAAYRAVGAELHAAIWHRVVSALGDAERVFLVPDGSINLVSFASLPDAADGYLVESGPTLHYLSASRDLLPAAVPATGRGLLALGGPDYDAGGMTTVASEAATTRSSGAPCEGFESLRFAPLPAAVEESAQIAALWSAAGDPARGDARRLTGAAASEAAFKRAAVDRRVLHVATHGFFLGGDCARAAAGSRGFTIAEAEPAAPTLTTPVSPLLLAGLALAGANRRDEAAAGEEDGVLTAEEIAGLDLSGVEWAVLSACDTGVGEVHAGEGVFGLRRAVQVAGVRTLIMSLWPVDDEATRAWMTELYRGRLERGLDTATAVRGAALAALDARRAAGESTHPFYWAAFVAAGEWK